MAEVEVRSLGVARPGKPRVFTWREGGPGEGEVLLQTVCSGISAGTELTFVKGSNPYLHASWDPRLGVFRAGLPAVRYPIRTMGYMEVGEVVESSISAVAEGTRVAMAYGHRSMHVAGLLTQSWLALPAGMHPDVGVLVAHMGPICANGLLHAAAEAAGADVRALGDGVRARHVLVMGGGVVGLLVGLFARHHGAAAVVLADPTPERRAAAEALGLDAAGGDDATPLWRVVKERWAHGAGDCGADVVFQCRGRATWLAESLRALRPQGTVIDLAFYDGGAEDLRLGEEFHHNGLAVRCAQIGRVPRGLGARWPRGRLRAETLALLRDHGELVRRVLVTDRLPLDDGPAFLADLVAHRRHALLAVLEFG